ncbi:MAG: hypothetical protein COA67_08120 [Lutibacter sp.]|nr:MAG: hypothetical protein COA67_08120 [Lutibacter sp.]
MDWKKYWNDNTTLNIDNSIGQVQRKDIESTLLTANYIVRILDIRKSDDLLDVCCGNGILTQQIAKKCNQITGVDDSEKLINVAEKNYNDINVKYISCNALNIFQSIDNKLFDKIYLQFSFQYFDKKKEGEKVISEMLKSLKPNGKIFIGDIPNHDNFYKFYGSFMKKIRYLKDKILNKNSMGKFWKVSELDTICKDLGVKGTFLKQPKELPYSHYRFDYLIEN